MRQRSLSHRDGGMSTAMSPTPLCGQGMLFIVYLIFADYGVGMLHLGLHKNV